MATTSGDESGTLLAHALACASAGYPVFPCRPRTKQRRTKTSERGVH